MNLQELIRIVESYVKDKKECLEDKKNNISNSYMMAKHDFRCIDNMEDCVETCEYILDKLNELQDRVIERNKINIRDL